MGKHLFGFCSTEERLGACSLLSNPAQCPRPVRMQHTGDKEGCLGVARLGLDLKMASWISLCEETLITGLIPRNRLENGAFDLAFQFYMVLFVF